MRSKSPRSRLLAGTTVAVAATAAAIVTPSVAGHLIAGGGRTPLQVINHADAGTVIQYHDIGLRIGVTNAGTKPLHTARLADRLPAGANLSWGVDARDTHGGCTLSGPVGDQTLRCSRDTLGAHDSMWVHLIAHTTSSTASAVRNTVTASAAHNDRVAVSTAVQVRAATDCRSAPVDASRTLTFSDSFTGRRIDPAKWNVGVLPFGGYKGSTHYHNTQYGSYVEAANSSVRDGMLDLTTDNIPVTHPDVPAIGTIPYTEGMVSTKDKFSQTGGYFEACSRFPAGKGLWPAFWLVAQNGNWPPEMDIAEWFGSIEAMQIGQPFATGADAGSKWLSTWRYSDAPTTGFHDYAMWWSPSGNTIRYYIDGQMVHEVDGTTATTIADTPMYIVLNSGTWASSGRGGPPDATTVFPNSYQTDYVRVYSSPPAQQSNSAP